MMYAQQSAAYSARDNYGSHRTDSTKDEPPSHSTPNLEELCNLKKKIVTDLPTNCVHCGADYPLGSIIELKDQCIVAYCKKKGACGKSLVLFAGLDLVVPSYVQVCKFEAVTPDACEAVMVSDEVSQGCMAQEGSVMPAPPECHEIPAELVALHSGDYPTQRMARPMWAGGETNPKAVCRLCGKTLGWNMYIYLNFR
jgi:hypothetical protein